MSTAAVLEPLVADAERPVLGDERLRVRVSARDAAVRESLAARLARAGITLVGEHVPGAGTVVLAAAGTVGEAVATALPEAPADGRRMVVVADAFTPGEVRHAVGLGVRVMLSSNRASASQLAAAVRCAGHGDGRVPYEVLVRLLNGQADSRRAEPRPGRWPLTARQLVVLALMAEGHGNRAIAQSLSCSEHTVKNLVHDMMARLQVRNRAHAVARAVTAGLI
ncbi:LuxR C-terminal-related transcriptional regulator [Kitasatospora sp. NPDC052896]|uniref:helix-turn-helix transcriptional regulator n=1 Tax=Kitasatospora sp. NPDC052896 TaxID=3364061 RepID=UPI0037CB2871